MTNIDTAQSPAAKQRRTATAAGRKPKAAIRTKAAPSKSDIVAKLLARPKGATVAEVSSATGWQPHSVRAFFSGLRKKGSALERGPRKDGTACYRLMSAAKLASPAAANDASASDEGTPAETGDEA